MGLLSVTLTQDGYRFYADGTEDASVALGAQQDIPIEHSLDEPNILLRVRIQSDGDVGASTDDYQLQYAMNLLPDWMNVTKISQHVRSYSSPSLIDGAATTNRLSGGTGSFAAGKISEDGLIEGPAIEADTFVELLWAITLDAARLSEDDAVTFRVRRNAYPNALATAPRPRNFGY